MSERRQYFRINDMVSLQYSVIDQEAYDNEIVNLDNNQHAMLNMLNTLNVLDSKLLLLVEQLRTENPTIAEAMNTLNKKVLIMGNMMSNTDNDAYAINEIIEVNISANGIAFYANKPLEIDTLLKLELVLMPEYHYCVVYGRVLKQDNEDNENPFNVSIEFEGISEADKEKIIQHVMKKQSEQLRSQKEPKLSAI